MSDVKVESALPTADEVEDEVMNTLPTMDATQLEAVCGIAKITVKEDMKGKRRELLKMVLKHLCTVTEEDDKMADILAIYSHLEDEHRKTVQEDDEEAERKRSENVALKTKSDPDDIRKKNSDSKLDSATGGTKSDTTPAKPVHVKSERSIEAVKIKDFKIDGIIGNAGSKDRITYCSLMYQVENAKKMRFSDAEISAGIIKKMQPDHDLKTLFELEPDIDLETMLEMLKSCYTERDSNALYTEFSNDAQLPSETAQKFVTRLMTLMRKVLTLSKEEGCPYDEKNLTKRLYHVMFTGLRNENIRSQLREKCKEDYTLPRKTILKYVVDIETVEKERQKKLFPKTDPSVNMVQMGGNGEDAGTKKKVAFKENPFTKIDDLRTEMIAEMKKEKLEWKAELCEIKNAILSTAASNQNQQNFPNQQNQQNFPNQQNQQNFPNHQNQNQPPRQNQNPQNQPPQQNGRQNFFPRRRMPMRCPNCTTTNAFRCYHCWQCGSDDHKSNACPGIAAAAPAPPAQQDNNLNL